MIDNSNIAQTIDAPSDKVWAAIRAIDGLDRWFPVIATCRVEGEGVGAIRFLELSDGKSEVTWAVELDVTAEARDELAAVISAAVSDGISGLGQDLQSRRPAA